eukprot:GDKI01019816.1.p1 GENE.GDKI01019816.1~~GDKI01019816.1.p1  ORF type:complete len:159 (+),score=48.56 GDKI01019816.1:368-844(+)
MYYCKNNVGKWLVTHIPAEQNSECAAGIASDATAALHPVQLYLWSFYEDNAWKADEGRVVKFKCLDSGSQDGQSVWDEFDPIIIEPGTNYSTLTSSRGDPEETVGDDALEPIIIEPIYPALGGEETVPEERTGLRGSPKSLTEAVAQGGVGEPFVWFM